MAPTGPGFVAPALPYTCDSQELPGPLPTMREIEEEKTTMPCLWSPAQKRILVVRGMFLVKYGLPAFIHINEGHALMLLHGMPTIPKLYAMYHHEGKTFVVMQFLPGMALSLVWEGMSEQEKIDVTGQLRAVFDRLRALAPPSPPVFCNITGVPVPQRLFMTNFQ